MQIKLQVNGEIKTCPAKTSLPQFLKELGLNSRLVVIEYNRDILHHQYWETTTLTEGDILEIVTIVGGG